MATSGRDLSRPHVWRPGKDTATAKTLLLLHGSGADEHDLLPLGQALDPSANLLSPRGLVRVEGVNRFFMLHAENTYDEGEVFHAASELSDFVWNAAAEYGFDTDGVYAVGFSNGANAAHSMLMLQPDSLAGAIAFGTNRVFENRSVFKRLAALRGKRVWIANGSADHYSPADRVEALVAELVEFGASVDYSLHAGGHTISHEQVRKISRQLAG